MLNRKIRGRHWPGRMAAPMALLALGLAGQPGTALADAESDAIATTEAGLRQAEEAAKAGISVATLAALGITAGMEEVDKILNAALDTAITGAPAVVTGKCRALDLLGDSTVIAFWLKNIHNLADVALNIQNGLVNENTLDDTITTSGAAVAGVVKGETDDLIRNMEGGMTALAGKIAERDHDGADNNDNCAGAQRAKAQSVSRKSENAFSKSLAAALDPIRDGQLADWTKVRGQKIATLLENGLFANTKTMLGDWIISPTGAMTLENQKRNAAMIEVLSNPHPVPAVPDDRKKTPGGRTAAMESMQKTAMVGVSEKSLRFLSSLQTPLASYVDAVKQMEEKGGITGDMKQTQTTGATGTGYSYNQLVDATQNYLLSPNVTMRLDGTNAAGALRFVLDIQKAQFDLDFRDFEGELHQTAMLAALLGIKARRLNEAAIEPWFSDNRK